MVYLFSLNFSMNIINIGISIMVSSVIWNIISEEMLRRKINIVYFKNLFVSLCYTINFYIVIVFVNTIYGGILYLVLTLVIFLGFYNKSIKKNILRLNKNT